MQQEAFATSLTSINAFLEQMARIGDHCVSSNGDNCISKTLYFKYISFQMHNAIIRLRLRPRNLQHWHTEPFSINDKKTGKIGILLPILAAAAPGP